MKIISKEGGNYRVLQTIGTSRDPVEIERLWQQAQHYLHKVDANQGQLFDNQTAADLAVANTVASLSNASIRTIGPELIFGTVFDRIGLDQIADELFRHLVIARLSFPTSKLKTVDYLYRYNGLKLSVNTLYSFLDRLHSRYKEHIEEIVYEHTKKKLGSVSVVFYDMTTLYFEAEAEDDLRKIGFSKDGKFQHPQIMLGLLVGQSGLPIGYDIYEGNTFEGHTLLPALRGIEKKYGFSKPIVVADAAMLSTANLKNLASQQYRFIIGGRIKNQSTLLKRQIIKKAEQMGDGDSLVIKREDGTRLIVTYSTKRAAKDAANRKKGLVRLAKRVKSGRLSKQNINNRGYNKFLNIEGEATISIDESKIEADQKWDGLKGYLTNTRLGAKNITEHYSHLWQIEKAFRISKTDLRIRPIYHYRRRRIEAHMCVAFAAYAIYKELERLLKHLGIKMSATRAGELTRNMYELHYNLPDSKESKKHVLKMDEEQKLLYNAIHRYQG